VRFLILSDIHGNWEALEGVLASAEGRWERAVCCGDLVGYGADPNACVEWVRENVSTVIRGNHDRACAGIEDLEWFNPIARAAALWTQAALTPENTEYLRALAKGPAELEEFAMVHGSPLDEDEYVVGLEEARELASYLPAPRCFFGHTHIQGGFEYRRDNLRAVVSGDRVTALDRDSWYLLNPGSVGQPRDGDPRAAYILYDSDEDHVELVRTPYDIFKAQRKILEAGLPEPLALRLDIGM
jgi:predicted phosphodiesterase